MKSTTLPSSTNAFDAQHAAAYDDRWAPLAPMRDSLHLQMRFILQRLPERARVLCAGVGTGAELLALARFFRRGSSSRLTPPRQ